MSLSIRKTITRSRNGCAVCKSKRLKCDEARPSCSRCERLGILCPGYKKPLKWSTGSRPSANKASTRPVNESGSPRDVSGYPCDRPQSCDQSAIRFFDSDFAEQFSDIISTGAIGLEEHEALETPLLFAEPFEDANQLDLDARSGPSSYVELEALDQNFLWQNTLSDTARPVSGVLQRRAPPPREMPLSKSLQDHSSILVEYYFKEVCGLMSCYDSPKNPYRTAISNVWSQSQSLYYVIQSMAAACLSEVSPNLSIVSRQLRDAAVSSLSEQTSVTQMDTSSLLALVMLGMSLSWHDSSCLGQSEFALLAKTVFSAEGRGSSLDLALADKQKKVFFYNSLIYWRMLLSFVTGQDLASPPIRYPHPQPSQPLTAQQWELRMPHPQTGLGIEVQELVANIGSLVRRERKRIRSRRYSSKRDIEQSKKAIQAAEELHCKLCAIDLPAEAAILDSGDEMTPTAHLLTIAEAYRCMGLLQLYRNFPDLLSHCQPTSSSTSDKADDSTDAGFLIDTWLTCLALHIFDLVQQVPVSSRSRSIQPLLHVSICSELSLSRLFQPVGGLLQSSVASIAASPRLKTAPTMADVLHARRIVMSRLACFENILAAKPVRQMMVLIHETWACMDEKQEDVYWMDVMMEKGYETLMG
ncbi:hypothetical protein AK830_g915 [Neonectria ditissima]|uniref:Zn(2)-C6 fungal-type domain-containing protein n=1 Tax=Neonectria ditissima TaxID=78410 RepID=A0A0P7C130_9HYPO|nr:hypothetical protein AK830_g915 [Neonectria ditissima]